MMTRRPNAASVRVTDDNSAAGGELDERHPPLVNPNCVNVQGPQFVGEQTVTLRVE
jgi:hypothetical protein